MNIAIIAHDAKKELMTQFCIAYCGILSSLQQAQQASLLPTQQVLKLRHSCVAHRVEISRSELSLPATK